MQISHGDAKWTNSRPSLASQFRKTALTPTRTQYDFVVRNLGSGSIMATQRVINTVPKEHFGRGARLTISSVFSIGNLCPIVGYVFSQRCAMYQDW